MRYRFSIWGAHVAARQSPDRHPNYFFFPAAGAAFFSAPGAAFSAPDAAFPAAPGAAFSAPLTAPFSAPLAAGAAPSSPSSFFSLIISTRSEERRVGKEGRSRW